jgi:hypothetical membrane protein
MATRALLICGVVAGPIYIVVGVTEMLTRPGFDVTRHDLSLLANGDWGWVHIALLVTTGLLTVAGAAGLRMAIRVRRGWTAVPLLVGLYGLGLVAAGFFTADPAFGFPPGTPASAHSVSWHGLLHLVCGAIGFLGLIAACLVAARRFSAEGQSRWAIYSLATGVLYLAAFLGIVVGSSQGGAITTAVILAFSVAVVLGWAWISAMAARPLTERA